jgi:hypothetical protein
MGQEPELELCHAEASVTIDYHAAKAVALRGDAA